MWFGLIVHHRFEPILHIELRAISANGDQPASLYEAARRACRATADHLPSAPVMVPLFVLVVSFAILRVAGLLGVTALNNVELPLRIALFLMFLLTASAHWGRGRADLIQMVPPVFPSASLLVSVTGVLEILGAVGLLVPATARWAAVCLAILLVVLFPANVRAARQHLKILGRPAPGLFLRTSIQVIFIAALIVVAVQVRG